MKTWLDKNLLKVIFAVWFVERIVFYTGLAAKLQSFMEYVERVLGLLT